MKHPIRLALATVGVGATLLLATPGTATAATGAAPAAAPAFATAPAVIAAAPAFIAVPAYGPAPQAPTPPAPPTAPAEPQGTVTINVGGTDSKPSQSIVILIALTVLSVAPALLLLCTSFTKVFVVLSITRNALGLTTVPPNQVLAGLALFISLFIMGPVMSDMNRDGVQPYLKGEKTQSVAFNDGVKPLREFMLNHTRKDELALFTKVANRPMPKDRDSVPLTTVVPAFALSELRAAFIIGFVIYIPFLVIDMIVSASLMSLGMMMLPPVTVSLPFKMLLFVLVNGWGLVVTALVASYH
ncbi:flagellar type III secretion system pore protein FliP [Planosporangium sp. 12N6]|uniref:flagellar type III secretion system pore protein FliP n=1 Tax=Planosporangium spinosum TaxID=3402278 RepID=UPI003CF51B6D